MRLTSATMTAAARALLIAAATCATAGCGSDDRAQISASPSPAANPNVYKTTSSEPAGCVRKTEDFRYVDARSQKALPKIQHFAPYADQTIRYYMDDAGGDLAVEIAEHARPPQDKRWYRTMPMVPVIDGSFPYGLHDRASVELLPSGGLARDFLAELQYRAKRTNAAQSDAAAALAGKPVSKPSDDSVEQEREKEFTAQGMPAVTALGRGSSPDDRYFKDLTVGGVAYNSLENHERLFACNYLEYRPYDVFLTIVRKRPLSADNYATLKSQLQDQHAPPGAVDDARYVADRKDLYVAHDVMPALWFASDAKKFDDSTVVERAGGLGFQHIFTVTLPTPDRAPQA